MIRYIGKRLLTGMLSLLMLVTITFFLVHKMPGTPFQTGNVSGEVLQAMEAEYGLDQPILKQYGIYLKNLIQGDLGISYKKPGTTVGEIIGRAWPATAALGILAILFSGLMGMLFGIWQAMTKKKSVRGGILILSVLSSGVPNFVIAFLLLLCFGVKFKVFPVVGLTSFSHYILPVLSLAAYPSAVITRLIHNTLKEELAKEYVVLAKAKGLSQGQILYRHIIKNAWTPVINYMGRMTAFLMTGSFVVESVFTIPGLGREFVNAIANRDYTLIMGLTIFMGTIVIIVTLAADLLCGLLDPRVRKNYLEN